MELSNLTQPSSLYHPVDKWIDSLKRNGMKFSELTLSTEGDYALEDVDWNYRDLRHMISVHRVEFTLLSADDNHATAIWQSKIFGLKIPMLVYSYKLSNSHHTGVTAFLGFVVASEDHFERLDNFRTRVTTTYKLGAPKLLRWALPLLRIYLKSKSHNLLHEDLSMRERRGMLRRWGFRFRTDSRGCSFFRGLNIRNQQWIAPLDPNHKAPKLHERVSTLFSANNRYLLGRSDHLGLRIERKGNSLEFYPRLCPHEGAELDAAPCNEKKLQCPWHGLKIASLATLSLRQQTPQNAELPFYRVTLAQGWLTVLPKAEQNRTESSTFDPVQEERRSVEGHC